MISAFNKNQIVLIAILTTFVGSAYCVVRADAPAAAGPPYTIAYKFVQGRTLRYSITTTMNDQASAGGQSVPMNMSISMMTDQTIQRIDPRTGNATEKVTMSGMTGTMNGQAMPFPAQAASSPPMLVTLTPSGQVVTTADAQGLRVATGSNFTDVFGKMSFLPKAPVNVGDTWTNNLPMDSMGLNIVSTMTLKAVNVIDGDTVALIETNITSTPRAQGQSQASMVNISGMSGSMLTNFDIDSGTAKSTTGQLVMSMGMNMPVNGQTTTTQMSSHMGMQMLLVSDSSAPKP